MRSFVPPPLTNPQMAEKLPGSMFTPAIAAWSSPGALGALPSWSGYAAVAAFLGLAYFRKIPWWAGLGGAALSYWYLNPTTNTVASLTNGTGIVANGTTLNFSANTPATLVTTPAGAQTVQTGGLTYPLLSQQTNTDGSVTYYLDSPTTS